MNIKLICVNNKFYNNVLTVGKIYHCSKVHTKWYTITNDKGRKHLYRKTKFQFLSKYREETISNILK
jgi:hypothetical protein